jgi:hypothetical protein
LTANATGTATSAIVSGLTNGSTYTFTVTAANNVGSSPASFPTGPASIGLLPGAPTDVTILSLSDGMAQIYFAPPISNGSTPISNFTLTSNPGGLTNSDGTFPAIGINGLSDGTTYTFTVTATNSIGTGPASAPSGPGTPTHSLGLASASNVSAVAGNDQATVIWNPALPNGTGTLTGYTVAPSGSVPPVQVPAGTTQTTVMGLTNGTAYTFTVTANYDIGNGPTSLPSDPITPMVPTVPSTATNVIATAGNTQATVTWTPAYYDGSIVTGYIVTANPGGASVTVPGSYARATVTGLTANTAYTFTVKAVNAIGTGPASAPSNSVTPTGGSGTISNLTVYDTANASNWSIQQNLQVGNLAYQDRTYTLASIPPSLLGSQWVRPGMASKTSTASPLVTFNISAAMTVYVAVDTRLGRRSWMDSTWTDTGTQIIDNENTPTNFVVFSKAYSAGLVSLGPNVGSGSTYVQYLVIAR